MGNHKKTVGHHVNFIRNSQEVHRKFMTNSQEHHRKTQQNAYEKHREVIRNSSEYHDGNHNKFTGCEQENNRKSIGN